MYLRGGKNVKFRKQHKMWRCTVSFINTPKPLKYNLKKICYIKYLKGLKYKMRLIIMQINLHNQLPSIKKRINFYYEKLKEFIYYVYISCYSNNQIVKLANIPNKEKSLFICFLAYMFTNKNIWRDKIWYLFCIFFINF